MFSGCPIVSFVSSSGQILLPRYLVNGLNNFDKTDREYLPAPTGDLIRFWRSRVEVRAGSWVKSCEHQDHSRLKYLVAEASNILAGGVKVRLLVLTGLPFPNYCRLVKIPKIRKPLRVICTIFTGEMPFLYLYHC